MDWGKFLKAFKRHRSKTDGVIILLFDFSFVDTREGDQLHLNFRFIQHRKWISSYDSCTFWYTVFQEVQTKVCFPLTDFLAVVGLSLNMQAMLSVFVFFFSANTTESWKFTQKVPFTLQWLVKRVMNIYFGVLAWVAEFQELDSTGFSYRSIFLFVWIWVISPIVHDWFTCIMPFLVTRREIFAV